MGLCQASAGFRNPFACQKILDRAAKIAQVLIHILYNFTRILTAVDVAQFSF